MLYMARIHIFYVKFLPTSQYGVLTNTKGLARLINMTTHHPSGKTAPDTNLCSDQFFMYFCFFLLVKNDTCQLVSKTCIYCFSKYSIFLLDSSFFLRICRGHCAHQLVTSENVHNVFLFHSIYLFIHLTCACIPAHGIKPNIR